MASLVLFVCTGNICRSPMAEAMFRLALPQRTAWRAASAGLVTCEGARASETAIVALNETGVDLHAHRSQQVTLDQVQAAGAIIVMTGAHMQQLLARFPAVRDKLFLLRDFDPASPRSSDLSDPFCGSLDDYRRCRDLIRQALPGLVRFLSQTAPAAL